MNRKFKKPELKDELLPLRLDSIQGNDQDGYYAEYDGWHFEAKSLKATFNQVLKYIFAGGEE